MMSAADLKEEQDRKSMDKKEIAEEEREKMLNEENTKHIGAAPAPDLESEDHKPKTKIPIGGIKMPGFCRTKSKEQCKEDESKSTGGPDGESLTKENEQKTQKSTTPAKECKDKDGRMGILDAIRRPLVSVFPRKKNKESDAETGTGGGAVGLASVETLDEGDGEKIQINNEEKMETIRLDGNVPNENESQKQELIATWLSLARRNIFATATILFVLLSAIVIIYIACFGPQRVMVQPLRDNKYMETLTTCGMVEGILEDGAYAFRGIPYALPPVGKLRWAPAKLIQRSQDCWRDTFPAHNGSELCWQRDANGQVTGSEDCLYLDVFTPKVTYGSPLPVVVMIGAETLSGGSPGIMQPSTKLARDREIVFVRPNFRLGIFGFLAAQPLSESTHPPTSGNYGLSDILAVLHWIQLNIKDFGGNKSAVTLWGHRAGGTLVTTLVGTYPAKDLFSQVWVSSGSAIFPGEELEVSQNSSQPFLTAIRCEDAVCLRNKTAVELMEAVPEHWHASNVDLPKSKEHTSKNDRHEWLVLDRTILQKHVGTILTNESDLPIKIVFGSTTHSGTPSTLMQSNFTLNSTQVDKIVRESLLGISGLADEALKRYNASLAGLAAMISDIRVVCPLLTVARMRSNIPFYVAMPPRRIWADADTDAAVILGQYSTLHPEEKRHITAMQQLFNHYVWHGTVAKADYGARKIILLVGQDTLAHYDYHHCDFWIKENIVPSYGRVD